MAGPLSLPEEFALLSLADTGKTIDSGQATGGCAVAELGELALRGKLLLRQRVHKVFGWNAIRQITHVIELVLCPEHERELIVGQLLEVMLCGR
ncbi:hypothetical protein ACPCTO_33825 [Streptomyces olivoreticuli]